MLLRYNPFEWGSRLGDLVRETGLDVGEFMFFAYSSDGGLIVRIEDVEVGGMADGANDDNGEEGLRLLTRLPDPSSC